MVAAQLWLLPHTRTDQLMSNVICISFGQPLVQSLLLTHVAESYPDFRNNVYAIGLKDDYFPFIMEKIDSLTITKEVCTYLDDYMQHVLLLFFFLFIRLDCSLPWRIYNVCKSSTVLKSSCL